MRATKWFLSGVLGLGLIPAAQAQVLNGSIVGQVADTSNAIVPDATIRITHRETNQSRVAASNAAGDFNFPTLPGGAYDVVISKAGFQTFSTQGVTVTAGQVARVDAELRIGNVSETVVVSAETAALQTDRAEVRAEISSKQLDN